MLKGKLYLIGFMGSGKSTISRLLADTWGCRRIEMDNWIEKREGMPISEIFARYGENYFREKETALLREIQDTRYTAVVSCGGGLPMREENREILRAAWDIGGGERMFSFQNPASPEPGASPSLPAAKNTAKPKGTVIYLAVRPETVLERLDARQTDRPVLRGRMRLPDIAALLSQREPLYREAAQHLVETDGKTKAEICREVLSLFDDA